MPKFVVLKDILSKDVCNELISSLPAEPTEKRTHTLSEISPIGEWLKGPITQRRCKLAVDDSIVNLIRNQHQTLRSLEYYAPLMYVTKYVAGDICAEHYDPSDYTVIILLNNDFTGGNLYVENFDTELSAGDAVVFQGKMNHRVSEVTNGLRYALSIWFRRNKVV